MAQEFTSFSKAGSLARRNSGMGRDVLPENKIASILVSAIRLRRVFAHADIRRAASGNEIISTGSFRV